MGGAGLPEKCAKFQSTQCLRLASHSIGDDLWPAEILSDLLIWPNQQYQCCRLLLHRTRRGPSRIWSERIGGVELRR
jgi:hypothetical protein